MGLKCSYSNAKQGFLIIYFSFFFFSSKLNCHCSTENTAGFYFCEFRPYILAPHTRSMHVHLVRQLSFYSQVNNYNIPSPYAATSPSHIKATFPSHIKPLYSQITTPDSKKFAYVCLNIIF